MNNKIERRRFVRLDVEAKVNFRIKEIDGEQVLSERIGGKSKNISVEGICFSSQNQLKIGSKIELEVFLPGSEPVHMQGEVAWSSPVQPKMGSKAAFDTGVKLLNIQKTDENKFLVYICNKMTERLNKYLGH